jgi:hypothetical protein
LRRSVFRTEKNEKPQKSVKRTTATVAPVQRHAATKQTDHHRAAYTSAPAPGSQREAQTALLLSVIRATPNDVFYTIAKDFLMDACNKAVAFFKPMLAPAEAVPSPSDNQDDRSGCRICPHCQSGSQTTSPSVLQSAEFLIFKAFIKLVVKLYLTLVLEVTTVALKLLG